MLAQQPGQAREALAAVRRLRALAASDDEAPIVKNRADDAARWSLWLAVLSALFPVVGQLGSVVLMWRAVDVGAALSLRARRQLIAAGAIDIATAAVWWSAI